MTDSTPNDELRELVEEWRELADTELDDSYGAYIERTYRKCANELEEVIND